MVENPYHFISQTDTKNIYYLCTIITSYHTNHYTVIALVVAGDASYYNSGQERARKRAHITVPVLDHDFGSLGGCRKHECDLVHTAQRVVLLHPRGHDRTAYRVRARDRGGHQRHAQPRSAGAHCRKIDDNTFVFSSPTAIPIPTTSDTDTETIIAPVKEFLTFPAPRRFPFAECRVLIGRHVPDDIERRLVAASLDSHPIIAISTDADTMFVPGSAPVVRRRPRHDIGSASLSLDDRHENAMHKLISCLNNAHRDSGSLTSPSASLPLAMAAARTNLELTAVSDRLAVIHSLRSLGSAPKRIRSN